MQALRLITFGALLFLTTPSIHAGEWLSFGGDPQRTFFAAGETTLSRQNVQSIHLQWDVKLDNPTREMHSLTAPIVASHVRTPAGPRDLILVAGVADRVFVVDSDNGKVLWQKSFQIEAKPKQRPIWQCPNGITATPVIEHKGRDTTVHVIASDGKLHSLNMMNGEDRAAPVQFIPAFAKSWSLNLVNGILYTTLSQGCEGTKSGIYAMDLNDPKRPVTFFQSDSAGGGIWGRAGVAVNSDGLILAETGDGPYDPAAGKYADTVLALSPKDLKVADYYTPANRDWLTRRDLDIGNVTPAIFKFHQWELAAAGGKEGVIYLMDAKNLGGESHRLPLFRSPVYLNEGIDLAANGFWGAFATMEDAGIRWLYAPAWGPLHSKAPAFPVNYGAFKSGCIMAFKVEERDGKPVLVPGWTSLDMRVPEPPIVANGLVFALESGEDVRQLNQEGRPWTSQQRAEASTHAVLHILDAATGKELFSSGNTLKSFTHFGGIALANGQVFVTTFDNHLYSFGLPPE